MSDCEKKICNYKSILEEVNLEATIKCYFKVPFQYKELFKQYPETKFSFEKSLWCITTYSKEQFKNTMRLAQLFEVSEVEYEFGNRIVEKFVRVPLKTIYSISSVTRILKLNAFNKLMKKYN